MNARYYNSSRGQFISQDPTFWGLKMTLNNPQSLNSYSYANDNPISNSDPDGLAATVAQQIQVLQAQVKILQGIVSLYQGGASQQASTAFAAYQTAFGGGGSSGQSGVRQSGSISTWRSNSTGGSTQMPNITAPLTKDMQAHSSDPWINNPYYFKEKVRPGGEWDLKNTPEYNSKTYDQGFLFDGQHVRSDAPGNIHYGYVGAATLWDQIPGVGPQFLLQQAGAVQGSTNTSQPQWQNSYFHGDDPVDQINILWGVNLYYNR